MKVPVTWLREYVDFDLPVEELARQLVFTSCEVDRIVRRGVPGGDNLAYFVVGKVLEADKHPNADKLQLTKVDVGEGEPRSIVCGAWNFGAGATVAVVVPGGVMPGGEFTIEKRKLRGEVSDGMILSERELELGQDHGGIMVLSDELAAGTPLADVLPLGEDVLEIETLYNRPDLTSIYGIAREVAALTGGELEADAGHDGSRPCARRRRARRHHHRRSRGLPAVHRAVSARRDDRRVAGVAEGSPDRGRHALDLERRRHHELRDARAGEPAPRIRRGDARRRTDRGAPRAARGGARHARRHTPRARPGRSRDRRCRAPDRAGGRDGRREHRGLGLDDVGGARDGELRAVDRAAQRRAPSHALREPDSLGERCRLRARTGRGELRHRAVRRARGRALDG